MKLQVALLPSLITVDSLEGLTVIVVDVLRATTVMATALAAGADRVITCRETDEAMLLRQSLTQTPLLGGERGGLPIPGFDFGNSPREYQISSLSGRTIVQTTTNGTLAIDRCRGANRLLTAAFVNLEAVARAVIGDPHVLVVCAGTNGLITGEDVLLAGAFVERVSVDGGVDLLDDQTWLAGQVWNSVKDSATSHVGLTKLLQETQGGRNLRRLNLEQDVHDAAARDFLNVVPICVDRKTLTFVGSSWPTL